MQGIGPIWVALCAIVVLLVAIWFVVHPDMKTGVLKTIGLAILSLGAVSRIAASWHDDDGYTSPLALFVWTGIALYMGGLARDFYLRQTRGDPTWYPRRRGSKELA